MEQTVNYNLAMNKFSAVNPYQGLTPEQLERARKAEAAREASRHSTGPKTLEGKRRSSQNARKHGFAGGSVVINEEDREAYNAHLDAYRADLQPINQVESDAVRLAADSMWLADQIGSAMSGLWDLEAAMHAPHLDGCTQNLEPRHHLAVGYKQQVGEGNCIELLRRYRAGAIRDYRRALDTFYTLVSKRIPPEVPQTVDAKPPEADPAEASPAEAAPTPAQSTTAEPIHLVKKPEWRNELAESEPKAEKSTQEPRTQPIGNRKLSRKARRKLRNSGR